MLLLMPPCVLGVRREYFFLNVHISLCPVKRGFEAPFAAAGLRVRVCARAWGISSSVPPLHINLVRV